nr:MAG TPA: hypothetical protein [Caudoviricetes sp.]
MFSVQAEKRLPFPVSLNISSIQLRRAKSTREGSRLFHI